MNDLITIIILYHNEGYDTIAPLLRSIREQQNFDFNKLEIVLSNNCDIPTDLYLGDFGLPIKYVYPAVKNSIAASRQCGLDNASGEYIIFCDCDDTISDPGALMHVVEETTNNPDYDIYHFEELIQYKENPLKGYYDPVPQDFIQGRNLVFNHGKVYRMSFIKRGGLHFNFEFSTHEDVSFNLIYNGLYSREYISPFGLYSGIQGPKSTSHNKDKDYRKKVLLDMIYCGDYSYSIILNKIGTIEHLKHDLINDVSYAYNQIKLNSDLQVDELCEKMLADFIIKFKLYDDICHLQVDTIGLESYEHFIQRILKLFPQDYVGMTLLSDNTYMPGQVALVKSLYNVKTFYPIYCVVTPEVTQENLNILHRLGVKTILKEKIIPDGYDNYDESNWYQATSLAQAGGHNALTKLSIFDLTQFKKMVYIDNDTLVQQNIDDLFDREHMSAVKDMHGIGESFCSGLMVIEPNHQEYLDLMNFFINFKTDGMIHDQLVLQKFFISGPELENKHIPTYYHTGTTYFTGNRTSTQELKNVKAFHYIDVKPGRVDRNHFKQMQSTLPLYVQLTMEYADYINKCILELQQQGMISKNLFIIK